MKFSVVATTFDLGRQSGSVRVGRFGSRQGDPVDAGVDLGAAKE